MQNMMSKASKRFMALLLSVAMIFATVPYTMEVSAATTTYPDSYTVSVTDGTNPVADATVSISNADDTWSLNASTQTDADGVAAFATADIIAALTIATLEEGTVNVTVTKDGFETLSQASNVTVADPAQNVNLVLVAAAPTPDTTITDVVIEGKELTYTGEAQELVSVTEVAGDTVKYFVGEATEPITEKPTATDAGTYTIKVVVTRDGKDPLESTVNTVIHPAEIDGFDIKAVDGLKYNGANQALVEVVGDLSSFDTVTWFVGNVDTESDSIPEKMSVGTYNVKLVAEKANYNNFEKEVSVEIALGEFELGNLKIEPKNRIYDTTSEPLLEVTKDGDYSLEYSVDEKATWVKDVIPEGTDAGEYVIYVKATKDGYVEKETTAFPVSVKIEKAEQSFDFDLYDAMADNTAPESIVVNGVLPYTGETYDFSATDEDNLAAGTISYAITADDGVAEIDTDGLLTVFYPGAITVTATLSGNENYKDCVINYYLNVAGEVEAYGDYIEFAEVEKDFVIGTSGVIADQVATKKDARIAGDISYSIVGVAGVEIDAASGRLTVVDVDAFAGAVSQNGGQFDIVVTATKMSEQGYGMDQVSYTVHVSFEAAPAIQYTLPEVDGTNGWYKTAGGVVVTAPEGYRIAMAASGAFEDNVTFNDQGVNKRFVYLQNEETNAITDKIAVVDANGADLKIDNIAPSANMMRIDIQDLTIVEKMGLKFGFYNPEVQIKFYVEDELSSEESGLDHIEWFYQSEDNATSSILADKNGCFCVDNDGVTIQTIEGKEVYVATLTVTATEAEQYRGHISFKAYDSANNVSDEKKENDTIVVVDTINPVMTAEFELVNTSDTGVYNPVDRNGIVQHYYNGDVAFTFTVNEANFFSDDVVIEVTKDNEPHTIDITWTGENTEIHYGKFELRGDGDYVVKMKYSDQSGNKMVTGNAENEYTSEVITIDTIAPVIEFESIIAPNPDPEVDVQKTIFTVKEHNFDEKHFIVTGTMENIKGEEVYDDQRLTDVLQNCTWTQVQGEQDIWQCEYDGYVDGIYNLTINYKDYSGWADSFVGTEFKIDHTAPENLIVEYVVDPIDKIGEFFGFYNAPVTVKFTATDLTTGVKSFQWMYTKQEGASEIDHPQNLEWTTVVGQQDSLDPSKFTAEVTLSKEEADQFRGYISVEATDNHGFVSEILSEKEKYMVIIDNKVPTLTVDYSSASRVIPEPSPSATPAPGSEYYYNGDVDVTLNLVDANFDLRNKILDSDRTVKPEVWVYRYDNIADALAHKDLSTRSTVLPDVYDYSDKVLWGAMQRIIEVDGLDVPVDLTVGTFTIKAISDENKKQDGVYVIVVNYTDRSSNEMDEYISIYAEDSGPIIIDTTNPVVDVEYNDSYYDENGQLIEDENNPGLRKMNTFDDQYKGNDPKYKDKTVSRDYFERQPEHQHDNPPPRTATITIVEHNFNQDEVDMRINAAFVNGAIFEAYPALEPTPVPTTNPEATPMPTTDPNAVPTSSPTPVFEMDEWTHDGDTHMRVIRYYGDANFDFDIDYSDKATNAADFEDVDGIEEGKDKEDRPTDFFTIDSTHPTDLQIMYSLPVYETVLEAVTFGFYNSKATVRVQARDDISKIHSFLYSYWCASNVSSVNESLAYLNLAEPGDVHYDAGGEWAYTAFTVPKDDLTYNRQFNGSVEFSVTNRSNITSWTYKDYGRRIIVDNIPPVATVSFSNPVTMDNNIAYYNGAITGTVSINEANFYPEDVQIKVIKDGVTTLANATWVDESVDVHHGTFTISGDGNYIVVIDHADKSGNAMPTYSSHQLVIDTVINEPTFSINGVAKNGFGGAYKGNASIGFNAADPNYQTCEVTLTRTRFDEVEDVTDKFVRVTHSATSGYGRFGIATEVINDGIYTLYVEVTDKSGNSTGSEMKFSMNRYGSVYEYSDALVELIKDGGQYTSAVEEDLVITEYNADRILKDSLNILITRDGEPIEVDYTSNPVVIDEYVPIGSSGWYQYEYSIKASNFAEDGVYKISLTSKYAAEDSEENESASVPENSITGGGEQILDTMSFTVDGTAPEIRNIVNLDKKIADMDQIVDGKLNVKYTIVDIGGLKSIVVMLNGKTIQDLTAEDFGDDLLNYTGSFDIAEEAGVLSHKVRIIATDLAGNVTDTDSEKFQEAHSANNEESTYVFSDHVTVSRNFFVRWYANTALFWGSIGGVVVVAGGAWYVTTIKRKKGMSVQE